MGKINLSRKSVGPPVKGSIGWHARKAVKRMQERQTTDSNQKKAKKVKHI